MGGARIFCLKLAKKMVLEDDARIASSSPRKGLTERLRLEVTFIRSWLP